ncbi:MAG: hypothetical protein ACE145_13355 [Terriglobia bacterium]
MVDRLDLIATGLTQDRQRPPRHNHLWSLWNLTALIFMLAFSLIPSVAAEVPVVKADLGPCSADFTVSDSAGKPIFDAKVHVKIVYGFMNKRKTELEVGTNSDGKARMEGLPQKVKKLLEFKITHGEKSKSIIHDPANECRATFAVTLDGN